MSLFVSRQKVILPSKEACGNCLNWDSAAPCEPYRHGMLCTSFEPIDPGNDEVVEVEVPYVREALGSEIKEEAVISN